jgi:hypothetical protein
MDEMINGLIAKTGIDKATAEKVVAFIKENAHNIPKWIGSTDIGKGLIDKLPDSVSGFLK